MIVGTAIIRLRLFTPHTLKEKRQIIKSLISKIGKYNVSIAEIGENDKWQLSEIGIAAVSNDKKTIDAIFNSIFEQIDEDERVEIIDIVKEML
ncbi:hypothetical protein ABG79_00168 [Caloramator mitchellensis]|uniref:YlxP-like protein n=1 Tax=Caloramator mitchellensis TaxID=908809 RepID=A0A0R3JWT6_CALMK|nr:DUF503 domain-containing protein [Caloramator mitchellensis]KRQ88003.1 hypothetical protein ABG79_00168 [Caloramator mitchellensis]